MQQNQQSSSELFNTHPALVTTQQIQKCLDENYRLIWALLDNQNSGKVVAESSQYQEQLQKNLTYLAAVADAQPQPQTPPPAPQVSQQATAQQSHSVQHPQSTVPQQQPGGSLGPKLPSQMSATPPDDQSNQHQMIRFYQQQQQQGIPFQHPMASQMASRMGFHGAYSPMQHAFDASGGYADYYRQVDASDANYSTDTQGVTL
ncbi:GRF1-interacting factor 3-like protein [Drosera capensis]